MEIIFKFFMMVEIFTDLGLKIEIANFASLKGI